MKKSKLILTLILIGLCAGGFVPFQPIAADGASFHDTVRGRILLDVETNGEAWYVFPPTLQRYYLGRPEEAFNIMRERGLGVSNSNLAKITIGLPISPFMESTDTDGDGLTDNLEKAIASNVQNKDSDGDGFTDRAEVMAGSEVIGNATTTEDRVLARRLAGRIVLKTEGNGEAFYINPTDLKRYYLGRPADAFTIMREQGLGITVANLNKISVASASTIPSGQVPSSGGSPSTTSPSTVAPLEMRVEAGEYWFTAPERIDVASGQDVRITFVNKGMMGHDLQIEGKGVGTAIIAPAGFTTLDVDSTLLTNGTITLYCSIGSHRSMGMEKKITVVKH